ASTSKEVEKLRATFAANPEAYIQSKNRSSQAVTVVGSGNGTAVRIGGSAATSAGSKIDASRIKSMHIQNSDDYKPSATTNNPIELTPKVKAVYLFVYALLLATSVVCAQQREIRGTLVDKSTERPIP